MKKFFIILFCLCSTYVHALSLSTQPTGTYDLFGSNNSSGQVHYRGQVTITSQGTNYRVDWKIGRQLQTGIGILCGNVLSVAYRSVANGSMGVVSFYLTPEGNLEGKWAILGSYSYGTEILIKKPY